MFLAGQGKLQLCQISSTCVLWVIKQELLRKGTYAYLSVRDAMIYPCIVYRITVSLHIISALAQAAILPVQNTNNML